MDFWECVECGIECEEGETYCDDCAWLDALRDDEPDVDEAQEWYDFDPDC